MHPRVNSLHRKHIRDNIVQDDEHSNEYLNNTWAQYVGKKAWDLITIDPISNDDNEAIEKAHGCKSPI